MNKDNEFDNILAFNADNTKIQGPSLEQTSNIYNRESFTTNNENDYKETIVIKEEPKYEHKNTEYGTINVKTKKKDIYKLLQIVSILPVLLIIILVISKIGNKELNVGKNYCKYIKTRDNKILKKIAFNKSDYILSELKDIKGNEIDCKITDKPLKLSKVESMRVNEQLSNIYKNIKFQDMYIIDMLFKVNTKYDNFENKKQLLIVKVDKGLKLINPNEYIY